MRIPSFAEVDRPRWFDLLFLVGVYAAINVFLWTSNSLYWDDWIWTGASFDGLLKAAQQLTGTSLSGLVMAFVYLSPPWLGHASTALAGLVPMGVVYAALTKEGVRPNDKLFISFLILLLPMYLAQFTLATTGYSIDLALFFLAAHLMIGRADRNWGLRILSLLLFFVSFSLNSLLVFYAVPFGYVFSKYLRQESDPLNLSRVLARARQFLISHWDFTAIPFLYWGIKLVAVATNPVYVSGHYAATDYNNIELAYVLSSPVDFVHWMGLALIDVVKNATHLLITPAGIVVAIALFVLIVYKTPLSRADTDRTGKGAFWGLAGSLAVCFLGLFSYLVIGSNYSTGSYESRHNLLLTFGVAFGIFFFFRFVTARLGVPKPLETFLKVLIIVSFSLFQLEHGRIAFWAGVKQQALINHFKDSSDVRNGRVFLVDDRTETGDQRYRFYEYSGPFWSAFGDEQRLATTKTPGALKRLSNAFALRNDLPFKIKDVTTPTPDHIIIIRPGIEKSKLLSCLRLLFASFFERGRYNRTVNDSLSIEVVPYPLPVVSAQ